MASLHALWFDLDMLLQLTPTGVTPPANHLGVSFRGGVTFFTRKATGKSTTKYLLLPQPGPEEIEFKN